MIFNTVSKVRYALILILIICAAFFGMFGCEAETVDSEESLADSPVTEYYHIIFHRNSDENDVTVDIAVPIDGSRFIIPDCTDDRIGFAVSPIASFNYWSTEPSGFGGDSYGIGDRYKKPRIIKAGESVDLYAIWKWQEGGYTIEYNANGGSGDMSSRYVYFGRTTLSSGDEFANTGCHVDKWNTKADGTGSSYTVGQSVINLSTENGATVTLYAQWAINTYTIEFNANGGSGTMSPQIMSYGTPAQLDKCTFIKDGREFDSWNTKADGTGTKYTHRQQVLDLTSDDGAIITLYVIWGYIPIGSVVYSDGTHSFPEEYDATKTPIGIVFLSNETQTKIVHLQEKTTAWCLATAEGYETKIETSESDGSGNWNAVCNSVTDENTAGNYPAFEYVNSLGSGWYFPAKNEVPSILGKKWDTINQSIDILIAAGVAASKVSTSLWSSCQHSNNNNQAYYYTHHSDGMSSYSNSNKDNLKNVRAVKVFNN